MNKLIIAVFFSFGWVFFSNPGIVKANQSQFLLESSEQIPRQIVEEILELALPILQTQVGESLTLQDLLNGYYSSGTVSIVKINSEPSEGITTYEVAINTGGIAEVSVEDIL